MNLTRLGQHQHPRPPHQELRQKTVFDSGARSIGQVANLYVDEDMELRFLDVCTSGFLGFGTKHRLVPIEAIEEESPGAVTLKVDQQVVEGPRRWPTPTPGRARSCSGPPARTTGRARYSEDHELLLRSAARSWFGEQGFRALGWVGPCAPLLQPPEALQLLDQPSCRPIHEAQVALPQPRVGLVAHAAQRPVEAPVGEHQRHRAVATYTRLRGHPQIPGRVLAS